MIGPHGTRSPLVVFVICAMCLGHSASAQFETRASTATFGGDFAGLAVGDFNRDGKLDFAVADNELQVFLGNGDGTFGVPTSYFEGIGTSSVAAVDLNGDHKLDWL